MPTRPSARCPDPVTCPTPMSRDLPGSLIATRLVRTLDISAASGLVLRDGAFHVVADDENALLVIEADGGTRRIALVPGELPGEHAARKARKPDFEILVDLRDQGLLAMGSGSRATRERAVLSIAAMAPS